MTEKKKIRVLVVDDETKLLDSYKIMLETAGFNVNTAENSKEAINLLNMYQHHVALVDLRIKDENGILLINSLKNLDKDIQIIIITGYPSHETAVEALKVGAYDYLSKTSETESIIETIEEAAEEYFFSKGISFDDDNSVKMNVICNNSFTKKGLITFCEKSKKIKIKAFSNNIPAFIKNNSALPNEIVLICGSCNFNEFDKTVKSIIKLKLILNNTVIVVFNHNLDEQQQIKLIKCGVSGFLDNTVSDEKTEELLLKVIDGEVLAPRSIVSKALKELSADYTLKDNLSEIDIKNNDMYLTTREQEILKCVARGLKNKEIAESLYISEKTVKTHMNNIFRKLDVDNRLQAINTAYKNNLIL